MSAIVPVRDGAAYLRESLPALMRHLGDELLELIVVDDDSSDGSGELAEEFGARVLHTERQLGPGGARNLGAEAARAGVLLFVDADVVVHPDAPRQAADAFVDPEVVGVFGSYDDAPRERNFASLYMNLRHHHVHQNAGGEARTFWAGCGAVRKSAFLAVGGFDLRRYPHPSIEDIDLGYRLRAGGGRILVVPNLQCTHLKRWTIPGVIHTDVFRRALPWSRLLIDRPDDSSHLNVTTSERLAAVVAGLLLLATALAVSGTLPIGSPLVFLAAAAWLNRSLLALFARRAGWLFATAGLLFHQLYYLYAGGAYAFEFVSRRLRRGEAGADLSAD